MTAADAHPKPTLVEEKRAPFSVSKLVAERAVKPAYEFEFDGDVYTLPSTLDLRAAGLLAAGELYEGLRVLLGPAQWDRLVASEAVFDSEILNAIYEDYAEATGQDLGESQASTRSSRRAAKK